MKLIDELTNLITNKLLLLDIDLNNTITIPLKTVIFNKVLLNCKLILENASLIKNIILLTKLTVKKLKLTKYNTLKQYKSATVKLIKLQQKYLNNLNKVIIRLNNTLSDMLLNLALLLNIIMSNGE